MEQVQISAEKVENLSLDDKTCHDVSGSPPPQPNETEADVRQKRKLDKIIG